MSGVCDAGEVEVDEGGEFACGGVDEDVVHCLDSILVSILMGRWGGLWGLGRIT